MNDFSGLEGWHGCVLAISACLAGLPHFCVLSLALTSQLISLFFSPDTFSEYGDVVWFVHFLIFNRSKPFGGTTTQLTERNQKRQCPGALTKLKEGGFRMLL
jgi:hypothetical protein